MVAFLILQYSPDSDHSSHVKRQLENKKKLHYKITKIVRVLFLLESYNLIKFLAFDEISFLR